MGLNTLKSNDLLMAWFDWVVEGGDTLLSNTDDDRVFVFAAAELATRKSRENPVRYFASIVGGGHRTWIKPYTLTAARARFTTWRRINIQKAS